MNCSLVRFLKDLTLIISAETRCVSIQHIFKPSRIALMSLIAGLAPSQIARDRPTANTAMNSPLKILISTKVEASESASSAIVTELMKTESASVKPKHQKNVTGDLPTIESYVKPKSTKLDSMHTVVHAELLRSRLYKVPFIPACTRRSCRASPRRCREYSKRLLPCSGKTHPRSA